MKAFAAVASLLLFAAAPAPAQETRTVSPGTPPPAANLADLSWLEGSWEGEGISGPARETYSPPMGGQIVGHFVQTRGDAIAFTEIVAIAQVGHSLEYRLKHFNEDMTGWEEKAEVHRFPLVAVEGDAFYFDGLTIRREGPDAMLGAVRVDNEDGTTRELVFRYSRSR